MKIASFIKDFFLNLRFSQIAFVGMRITGIALAFFLLFHMYSVGTVTHSDDAFNNTMEFYNSGMGPVGHWVEFLLLLAVLFHAANGVRVMIGDFFGLTRYQRGLFWGAMAVAFVIAVAAFPQFILGHWYW